MSLYIILIIMLFSGMIGGWINSMLSANIDPATKQQIQSTRHCILIGIGATILVPLFLQMAQSNLLDNIHADFDLKNNSAHVVVKVVTDKKKKADTDTTIVITNTSKIKGGNDNSGKPNGAPSSGSSETKVLKGPPPEGPADGKHDDEANAAKNDGLKAYLIFMAYCFLAAAAGPRFINNLINNVIKEKQLNNAVEKNKTLEAEKGKVIAEKDAAVEQKQAIEKKQELQTIENRVQAGKEEQKALEMASFTPLMRESLAAAAVKPEIGPITVSDDPQKGRFGGKSEVNGRALKAKVEKSLIPEFYNLSIWVESTDESKPLDSDVLFYLHDTFRPAVFTVKPEDFKDGRAVGHELLSYGAFTVGAVTDGGNTLLELDLAEDFGFPEKFRRR